MPELPETIREKLIWTNMPGLRKALKEQIDLDKHVRTAGSSKRTD